MKEFLIKECYQHKAYRTTIPADCATFAMSICQYKNTENTEQRTVLKSNNSTEYLPEYLPRFTEKLH